MNAETTDLYFDESDPRVFWVNEGVGHLGPEEYRTIFQRWSAWLDAWEAAATPARFGVVLMHGHHDHDEDEHEHERDEASEAEIVKLLNDFRRDERARIAEYCTGFANVYESEDVVEWYTELEPGLERLHENWERFSQYNFGIPARVFTEPEEARRWLRELEGGAPQVTREPAAPLQTPAAPSRVGLFYGSTTGSTEIVADALAEIWQAAGQPALEPINITFMREAEQLLAYDCLILGIPTWNVGLLQDDWELLFPALDGLDFSGKQVAIFGVGDAQGYPDNFLDAVGILGRKLRERGAHLVGYWSTDGYDFDESLALEDGRFMGLGIDETNQPDETTDRLWAWVEQLIHEFALEAVADAMGR